MAVQGSPGVVTALALDCKKYTELGAVEKKDVLKAHPDVAINPLT